MKLGFTYDEKVFNSENRDLLLKAKQLGMRSLEISPDTDVLPAEEYKTLIDFAVEEDLEINYHIPYFASKLYSPKSMISDRNAVLEKYDEWFRLLRDISVNYKGSSVIVFHGEDFLLTEDKSRERTLEIIRYCLDKISEYGLNCRLAMETLRAGSKRKVGDNHDELLHIVDEINSDRFGICLDICHDCMNSFPYKSYYTEKFLSNLIYLHAHGMNLSENYAHISIVKSSVNFLDIIMFLKERKPDLTLNIELLSDVTGDTYISDLFFDLYVLNSLMEFN